MRLLVELLRGRVAHRSPSLLWPVISRLPPIRDQIPGNSGACTLSSGAPYQNVARHPQGTKIYFLIPLCAGRRRDKVGKRLCPMLLSTSILSRHLGKESGLHYLRTKDGRESILCCLITIHRPPDRMQTRRQPPTSTLSICRTVFRGRHSTGARAAPEEYRRPVSILKEQSGWRSFLHDR